MESPSSKTILIVEDVGIVRVGHTLSLRDEGYNVVSLGDCQQALKYLQAGNRPDLLMLDLAMPGMDGWQFLEELQRSFKSLGIPIVLATAADLKPGWLQEQGCNGYLQKPFDSEELLAEIKRWLP